MSMNTKRPLRSPKIWRPLPKCHTNNKILFHNKRIPVKNWNVRIGYDGTSTSVCNILLKLYLTCKNYYSHNIGFLYIRVLFIRIPIFCRHLQKHIWELLNMKFEYTIVAYITIHVNLDSDLSALWQMISNEESSFVYLEIHFYCLIFNKWS